MNVIFRSVGILRLPSNLFYESSLLPQVTYKQHPDVNYPLVFICTSMAQNLRLEPEKEVIAMLETAQSLVNLWPVEWKDVECGENDSMCLMARTYHQVRHSHSFSSCSLMFASCFLRPVTKTVLSQPRTATKRILKVCPDHTLEANLPDVHHYQTRGAIRIRSHLHVNVVYKEYAIMALAIENPDEGSPIKVAGAPFDYINSEVYSVHNFGRVHGKNR